MCFLCIYYKKYIGLDKSGYQIVFLFLDENICCGYSLEVPRQGPSDEYPQHMFLSRNKKNMDIFWLKKKHLIKSYEIVGGIANGVVLIGLQCCIRSCQTWVCTICMYHLFRKIDVWTRCSKISFIELSHPLQLRDFNRRMKGERTDVICPQKWTNTDRKPPYVIGKEVRATEKWMVKEWMWSVPRNDWLLGLGWYRSGAGPFMLYTLQLLGIS